MISKGKNAHRHYYNTLNRKMQVFYMNGMQGFFSQGVDKSVRWVYNRNGETDFPEKEL